MPSEKGLHIVKVLTGPCKGVKIKIDIRKGGSYFYGNYDKWIFKRINLNRFLEPGMVAWYCGAFYGYYGAVFRKLVGENGRVEIFEASQENYQIVSTLPYLNKWDNGFVHKLAVGPDHSKIAFKTNLGRESGPLDILKTGVLVGSDIEV